jgi:hypothetical protein
LNRVTGNPWFKRRTMLRGALDVLRAAQGPMTVPGMGDAMLTAKGITEPTAEQWNDLQGGLRASLEGHSGKTVEVGEGSPMCWRLMS